MKIIRATIEKTQMFVFSYCKVFSPLFTVTLSKFYTTRDTY